MKTKFFNRYGENCKAAIIRLGFQEMRQFIRLLMNNQVDKSVFWEPCAFADLIATCYGGVTGKIIAEFAKSKKVNK
jgi:Glycerol-3-phosphate dehydrogenase